MKACLYIQCFLLRSSVNRSITAAHRGGAASCTGPGHPAALFQHFLLPAIGCSAASFQPESSPPHLPNTHTHTPVLLCLIITHSSKQALSLRFSMNYSQPFRAVPVNQRVLTASAEWIQDQSCDGRQRKL